MTTQISKKIKKVSILVIGLIGLVNFGFCGTIQSNNEQSVSSHSTVSFSKGICLNLNTASCRNNASFTINGNTYTWDGYAQALFCFTDNGTYYNGYTNSCMVIKYDISSLMGGDCPTCEDQYTSEECEQEYSLMPISSCNSEYCELNNMCGTGENFNRSPLYINEVLQEGAPIIKVTIPEEINYDSQVDTGEFNLDIIGYGYDQDKMQQMVNTQHYAPTSEDMSNLVAKIADFLPLLAVALLVIWIRWCIKKVFRH